jgi:polysaccharide deacetylase 2 family uncharacterized protein YibQ
VSWIVTWPLTLAFAVVVFLSARELSHTTEETTQPIGGPDWEARFPARVDTVTAALARASLPLSAPTEEAKGSGAMRWLHRRYRVQIKPGEREVVESVIDDLRHVDPGLTISPVWIGDGAELRIGLDGLLTHTVELRWGDPVPITPPLRQVAMIVATLGDDLRLARELVGLEATVGLAVRPFRPFSKEVAELAHHFEREVWLDLTAAPDGEALGGDTPVPADEKGYLESALASVPYAVGVTRGRATVAAGQWSERALEAAVKQRNLLYVADVRAPKSAARLQTMGIALDDESLANDALANLGARAQEHGPVVGIGAGAPPAAEALRRALPEWRKAGVDVVPASQLVRTTPQG